MYGEVSRVGSRLIRLLRLRAEPETSKPNPNPERTRTMNDTPNPADAPAHRAALDRERNREAVWAELRDQRWGDADDAPPIVIDTRPTASPIIPAGPP